MREILFRAKRADNGEWIEGCLSKINDEFMVSVGYNHHSYLDMPHLYWIDVCRKTISQFTGVLDKNGNKIFENDILYANGSYPLTVLWDNEEAKYYAKYIGVKHGHEDDDSDDWAEAYNFNEFYILGNSFDKEIKRERNII